jgi:hypothetical protein
MPVANWATVFARRLVAAGVDGPDAVRLLDHLTGDRTTSVGAGVDWPDTVFRDRVRRAADAVVFARTTRNPTQLDVLVADRRVTVLRALVDNPRLHDRHRHTLSRRLTDTDLVTQVLEDAGDAVVVAAAADGVACDWHHVLVNRDLQVLQRTHTVARADAAMLAFRAVVRRDDAEPPTVLAMARHQIDGHGSPPATVAAVLWFNLNTRNAQVLVDVCAAWPDTVGLWSSPNRRDIDPDAARIIHESGNRQLWDRLRTVDRLPADVAEALADTTGQSGWLAFGCTPERAVSCVGGPNLDHALAGVVRHGQFSDALIRALHRRGQLDRVRHALHRYAAGRDPFHRWLADWAGTVVDDPDDNTAALVYEVLTAVSTSALRAALAPDRNLWRILPQEWLVDMVRTKLVDLAEVSPSRPDVLAAALWTTRRYATELAELRQRLVAADQLTPALDALTAHVADTDQVDVDNLVRQADANHELVNGFTVVAGSLLRRHELSGDQLTVLLNSGLVDTATWTDWVAGDCRTPFDVTVAADALHRVDVDALFTPTTAARLWTAGVRDERLIAVCAGEGGGAVVTDAVEDALRTVPLSRSVVVNAAGHSHEVAVRWIWGDYPANPPTVEHLNGVRNARPGPFFDAVYATLSDPDVSDAAVDLCLAAIPPASLVATLTAHDDLDGADVAWRNVTTWFTRHACTGDALDAFLARLDTWPGSFAELVELSRTLAV